MINAVSTGQSVAPKPHLVSRAVVLAAGSGQRLKPLTNSVPKCLVEVGGVPILLRTLTSLAESGIRDVVLVVGHLGERVIEAVGDTYAGMQIEYVWSPHYESTNNIVSLWEARSLLTEDVLLIESDVVFEGEVLRRLMATQGNAMVVSPYRNWYSGTVVSCNGEGGVAKMTLAAEQADDFQYGGTFKTVNIYRLERSFLQETYIPAICDAVTSGDTGSYYESVLSQLITSEDADFAIVDVGDRLWYEVDDHNDLESAEYMFATPAERLKRVQGLHGGYWRYGFTDHSYLDNLYFPPDAMLRQFQHDMRDIITSYPVGHEELARMVSDWTGVPSEQVVVANGASELIKILGADLASTITIPVPSFNEYENVIEPAGLTRVYLDPVTFDLDTDVFARAAISAHSKAAIVVTPNNPTSLSVPRARLLELAQRLRQENILLVVDESFIDFARDGMQNSVQPFLDEYPNIVLIKSMSKVFGIAGLRLGYLLCSDQKLITSVRAALPIWNINGLGEAFLRNVGRYRGEFLASCEKVKADRDELYGMLLEVPGIEPVMPDANFILAKLEHSGLTAPDLVQRLFHSHNILVKDCAGKSMRDADRYLRIASRTPEENRKLVEALRRLD